MIVCVVKSFHQSCLNIEELSPPQVSNKSKRKEKKLAYEAAVRKASLLSDYEKLLEDELVLHTWCRDGPHANKDFDIANLASGACRAHFF